MYLPQKYTIKSVITGRLSSRIFNKRPLKYHEKIPVPSTFESLE